MYNAHSSRMKLILTAHSFKGFKMVFIFVHVPLDGDIELFNNCGSNLV